MIPRLKSGEVLMQESPQSEIWTDRISQLRVLVPVKWIEPVPVFRQQLIKIQGEALGWD